MKIFNILFIGPSCAGKTVATSVAHGQNFSLFLLSPQTLGTVFTTKELEGSKTTEAIKVILWEVGGHENFADFRHSQYGRAPFIGICIDLSLLRNKNSALRIIDHYLADIQTYSTINNEVYLIGTKSDLLNREELAVATENLREIAEEKQDAIKLSFISSAKNNTSRQLGATRVEDKAFENVLGGIFERAQTLAEAEALANSRVQNNSTDHLQALNENKITRDQLHTILQTAKLLRPSKPGFFTTYVTPGSNSIFRLNALLRDNKAKFTFDGATLLACLTPKRKNLLNDWVKQNCPPSTPCDSIQLALRNVYRELKGNLIFPPTSCFSTNRC